MTKKGAANRAKIAREESDLKVLLQQLPTNPIQWLTVVKIVGPLIARLAVRYALKRLKRDMSEERVNTIGEAVAGFVEGAVKRSEVVDGKVLKKK